MDSPDSTITHWKSLAEKARRGGWGDDHALYDPILYTRSGIGAKALYRRIFQVPFLVALYGEKQEPTGLYDKELNEVTLPRYWKVSQEAHALMMRQDHDSVLAFLDSVPTEWERGLPTREIPPEEAPE